jgi:hypothetical protein
MNVIRTILGVAIGLVVSQVCPSAATTKPATLKLGMHQTVDLPGSSARVTFIHAKDERCPQDVQCLFDGPVYALLWFELGAQRKLLSVGLPNQQADAEVPNKFFGYEFCFVSLHPLPHTRKAVRPQDYVLQLTVQQTSSEVSSCRDVA